MLFNHLVNVYIKKFYSLIESITKLATSVFRSSIICMNWSLSHFKYAPDHWSSYKREYAHGDHIDHQVEGLYRSDMACIDLSLYMSSKFNAPGATCLPIF